MVKSIEEQYQKKTQLEHILLRPDTYVGSIETNKDTLWIYDLDNHKIIKKEIDYTPALYKIFDEILVNSRDACMTDKTTNELRIKITKNRISVENNGIGIPVELHKIEKCYVPELIFGHFRTGSNFDDDVRRTTGGRNGLGAKLTNAFSKEFIIETIDLKNKKYFKQTFRNNMSWKRKAIVEDVPDVKIGNVKIEFEPDLKRFKMEEISGDMINFFKKRVFDIAATLPKVKVFLNDKLIEENTLKKYINLYYQNENVIYEDSKEWQIGIIYIPDNGFEQVSFVNGINTFNGGTHVNYIINNIIKKLDVITKKKHKDIKIKPSIIKENLVIFINSIIINPQFSSQTKEELKTKANSFGSSYEITDKSIKKLVSQGLIEQIINFIRLKDEAKLKKNTDGRKENTIKGIPKLEDANKAGGKESHKCFLILTEGDSAKALAMSGRSVVGNDYYGVFPLKGKLLNVREATASQLLNNEEIKNIKKIMGLQHGKKYNNVNDLRYGGIIIFTDQDTDGFHIKGLLINCIHFFWPSLLINCKGFINSLSTPIVKATKGKRIKCFYNMPDYEKWQKNINIKSWNIKYYKGLGTSNSKEAKEYFTDILNKLITYKLCDENNVENENICEEAIKLAFEKKQSNNRKKWLLNDTKDTFLDNSVKNVEIKDFINKELKLFSYDDLERSIPSIVDGLKPSTRKILYACFLRKLYNKKDEIKVSQLAGYIADKTSYHHGEASLIQALINMAQNHTGSNNINLLVPSGQFGTRLLGGKDHASPRYIFTYLESLTRYIFKLEDDDILNYLTDDGSKIQPDFFLPIVPMILINGSEGIGTGFSTFIPPHNPIDIIKNIFNLMEDKELKKMKPWYKKFKGKVRVNNNTISIIGHYNVIDDNTIQVSELPIGQWTTPYKEFLETIEYNNDNKKDIITNFKDNNTESLVNFELSFPKKKLELFIKNDTLESKLKLIKTVKNTNMHLYDKDNNIKKYESNNDILKEWYEFRLSMYVKRKEYIIGKLTKELNILKYKAMFIEYVLDDKIIIYKQKKSDIIDKIEELEFPKLSINNNNESYDYITLIPLFSLTIEKINELNDSYKKKDEELELVISTSEVDIWKNELKEFLKNYTLWKKIN